MKLARWRAPDADFLGAKGSLAFEAALPILSQLLKAETADREVCRDCQEFCA